MEFIPTVSFLINRSDHFSVTVKSWHSLNEHKEIIWHWNVYANLFEQHPLSLHPSKAKRILPLHWGASYDRYETSEYSTNPTLKAHKTLIIGSDYQHIHDNYTGCSPFVEIPHQIKSDALELVEFLKAYKEDDK